MGSFEYFDHTADIGMRVEAESLPALFEAAVEGMTSLLVADRGHVQVVDRREIELENEDPAYLLFDLLNEVLYLFEAEKFVAGGAAVEMTGPNALRAELVGEPFDPTRHQGDHEVKAVTYHGLVVRNDEGTWRAEVIFDI